MEGSGAHAVSCWVGICVFQTNGQKIHGKKKRTKVVFSKHRLKNVGAVYELVSEHVIECCL